MDLQPVVDEYIELEANSHDGMIKSKIKELSIEEDGLVTIKTAGPKVEINCPVIIGKEGKFTVSMDYMYKEFFSKRDLEEVKTNLQFKKVNFDKSEETGFVFFSWQDTGKQLKVEYASLAEDNIILKFPHETLKLPSFIMIDDKKLLTWRVVSEVK